MRVVTHLVHTLALQCIMGNPSQENNQDELNGTTEAWFPVFTWPHMGLSSTEVQEHVAMGLLAQLRRQCSHLPLNLSIESLKSRSVKMNLGLY